MRPRLPGGSNAVRCVEAATALIEAIAVLEGLATTSRGTIVTRASNRFSRLASSDASGRSFAARRYLRLFWSAVRTRGLAIDWRA